MIYRDLPRLIRSILALLPLVAFLLHFGVAFLSSLRNKRRLPTGVVAMTMALLSLAHLFILLSYEEEESFAAELLDSFPNAISVAISVFLFASGLCFFVYFAYRRRHYLSLTSFQNACDAMETGVCFYKDDGTLLLTNRYLISFCERYLHGTLLNANGFLSRLESGQWDGKSILLGGKKAYQANDGEVFVLSFSSHEINKKKVNEFSITPVGELYRLSVATRKSNEELKESNKRLRRLGKEIARLKKEEENLIVKKRIHDDLGGLLLYARSCLDKDLNEEEKEALLNFLEKESRQAVSLEKKEVGEGLLDDLMKAGEEIGVAVLFEGDEVKPEEEVFVYEAAKECLLNAYRHGKAKTMKVVFRKESDATLLSISNDGVLPSGEVKEGSGLSSLRSLVESNGGKMKIETSPKFELKIKMERKL